MSLCLYVCMLFMSACLSHCQYVCISMCVFLSEGMSVCLFSCVNFCPRLTELFINHREKSFFKYYQVRQDVCMYVCIYLSMYVIAIVATPFNLQLWNFGTTFLMWLSKNRFLKFLKNCFFAELLPFLYISLRFLCNFEEEPMEIGMKFFLHKN